MGLWLVPLMNSLTILVILYQLQLRVSGVEHGMGFPVP